MAFLAPKQAKPETGPQRQPYEFSGALPVVMGRARVPLQVIESPFNHVQTDHGDRRPKGNVYSLVLAGCHGPVDRLFAIYFDGKPRWEISAWRSGDFTDLTYGSHANGRFNHTGRLRVYWGTQTQTPDALINGARRGPMPGLKNPDGSNRNHPPYTGIFYIVWDVIHFDDTPGAGIRGSTSLPQLEADVYVQPPFNGTAYHEFGANPIATVRELLRNRIWGAALPASIVPDGPWHEAAQRMHSEGYSWLRNGQGDLSALWASSQDLEAVLADYLSYFDGFLRLRDGQLLPGWFPNAQSGVGEVTTLSRHDLLDEADVDPGSWEDTFNEVSVEAKNVYEMLSSETVNERNTYNRRVTGSERKKNVDAPFIIHPLTQRVMARRTLRNLSQPTFKARLKVSRSRARNPDGTLLLPGDLVRLNLEPYALNLLCRVIEREDRGSEVLLSLENERGRFAEDYLELDDPRLRPRIEEPLPIAQARVFELPEGLSPSWPPRVAILAERPHASTVGAEVWISGNGQWSGEEQQLAALPAFVATASLEEPITALAHQIKIRFEGSSDFILNRSFTDAEQRNGEALLLAGDELISLGALVPAHTAPPIFTYGVQRGAFATLSAAHANGLRLYLFSRDTLERLALEHALLNWQPPYDASTARVWFRLRAFTGFGLADFGSTDWMVQLRNRSPSTPTGLAVTTIGQDFVLTWQNPSKNYLRTEIREGMQIIGSVAGTSFVWRGPTALTVRSFTVRSVGPNGTFSNWSNPVAARNGVDPSLSQRAQVKLAENGAQNVTSSSLVDTVRPTQFQQLRMRVSVSANALFTEPGTFTMVAFMATRRKGTQNWNVLDGNGGRPLARLFQMNLDMAVGQQFRIESYFAFESDGIGLGLPQTIVEWAVHVPGIEGLYFDLTTEVTCQMDGSNSLPPPGPQLW